MTANLECVYFSVNSKDTRDVFKRGQETMASKMRSRTLQLLVKHSVIDTLNRFQSPGNLSNLHSNDGNDSPSVSLKPQWLGYTSNIPRLSNLNAKTAQEAY